MESYLTRMSAIPFLDNILTAQQEIERINNLTKNYEELEYLERISAILNLVESRYHESNLLLMPESVAKALAKMAGDITTQLSSYDSKQAESVLMRASN